MLATCFSSGIFSLELTELMILLPCMFGNLFQKLESTFGKFIKTLQMDTVLIQKFDKFRQYKQIHLEFPDTNIVFGMTNLQRHALAGKLEPNAIQVVKNMNEKIETASTVFQHLGQFSFSLPTHYCIFIIVMTIFVDVV